MNIKTGILAAGAVLALTVPAAALAQPHGDPNFAGSYYYIPPPQPAYAPAPAYAPPRAYDYDVSRDFRRDERREQRRMERLRRWEWERRHGYRGPSDWRW